MTTFRSANRNEYDGAIDAIGHRRDRHAYVSIGAGADATGRMMLVCQLLPLLLLAKAAFAPADGDRCPPAVRNSFWTGRRGFLVGGLIYKIMVGRVGAKLGYTLR